MSPERRRRWATSQKKRATKERRRALYEAKMARKAALPFRRSQNPPRDQKRRAFMSWFIRKKVHEEYMVRKARQAGLDWKIRVAVLLERIPIIFDDKETWETEYEDLRAYLDQFGKAYPKALMGVDPDAEVKALTDEDLIASLPPGFTPAPRETEADATGDVRTTDRKLKTNIYLAVQQPTSQDSNAIWQFPTVDLNENENLLDAAKRALETQVGPSVEFWCPSNAPWAVDLVPYDSDSSERTTDGLYGIKTFFIKVQYDIGQVSEREMKVKDYAWLDRAEAVEQLCGKPNQRQSTLGDVQNLGADVVASFYHAIL